MDVLDAIASIDARLPDGLLVALAKVPGVAVDSIVIRPIPRSGRHGRVTVTWTQDARNLSAEGHTLDVALRRALRASERVSAKAKATASTSTAKG